MYLTNEHPDALGVWVVCNDNHDIVQVFNGTDAGRFEAVALLASAYDWDALTAAGDEALCWEADPAIAYEDQPTSDRRQIDGGALVWRTPPLPLMVNFQTTQQHQGAMIAGAVDEVTRLPDGLIHAHGRFDTGIGGQEAARLVDTDVMRGVSLDMTGGQIDVEVLQVGDGGMPSDWLEHFVAAEMGGLTITPFPAFASARIRMRASATAAPPVPLPAPSLPSAVAAAGGPLQPPVEWFENPELSGPTPLTILDDGQVFGHIATWGTCHIGRQDACISAPSSVADYAYFTTGLVRCADGCEIPVGQLTLGTGHADLGLDHRSTAAHYDNTGTAVADLAIGEDPHGVWVAGALRPGLDDEQIRTIRAAGASGDWRKIGGHLELVALLAVNVPGFPIPRPRARVASGVQTALVAAAAPTHATYLEGLLFGMRQEWDRRIGQLERTVAPLLGLSVEALDALMGVSPDDAFGYLDGSPAVFKYISQDERNDAAKAGAAMPGGRFPIRNGRELAAAIRLYGQAPDKDAVKAHIVKRARALGLTDQLPKGWAS